MRTRFLLFCFLFTAPLLACNDHIFRIGLNQRSFYNPAALCPYCDGSWFISSGLNFGPDAGTLGVYFSGGYDANKIAHGPFDFTYAQLHEAQCVSTQYAFRYAFAQQLGASSWKVAVGLRGSYYTVHEWVFASELLQVPPVMHHAQFFDVDAGAMLVNKDYGFYFGVSAQHIGAPHRMIDGGVNDQVDIALDRTYTVMTGYVQRLGEKWDLVPDLAYSQSKDGRTEQMALSVRYLHHFGLGGGVTIPQGEDPQFDIRGGYTSSKFKWLVAASPSDLGWNVETGIVVRFGFENKNGPPCTGGACTPPPAEKKKKRAKGKDEFAPHR